MADKEIEVQSVVQISSNYAEKCPKCDEILEGFGGNWDKAVNHLMSKHRYKLLHVGGESDRDDNNKPIQHTVAVLGEPKKTQAGVY